MDQREQAQAFRRMHQEPPILVLPNAWDVASARLFADVPGCRALATTSAAVARAIGFEDGERAPRDEMVGMAGRIAAAVGVPVTADLERGYGDPVGTAQAAWAAGVVGLNFEDSSGGAMVPLDEQVAALEAMRSAVPELVLNARVDVFLRGAGGVDEALERGNAYLAAGADCVYPIFCPADVIGALAAGFAGADERAPARRHAAAGRARAPRRRPCDVGSRARSAGVRGGGAVGRRRAQLSRTPSSSSRWRFTGSPPA
jgi:2-methylisocitrate lyase-like PEP mutase family enzyme